MELNFQKYIEQFKKGRVDANFGGIPIETKFVQKE